jgi:hypothetical protein
MDATQIRVRQPPAHRGGRSRLISGKTRTNAMKPSSSPTNADDSRCGEVRAGSLAHLPRGMPSMRPVLPLAPRVNDVCQTRGVRRQHQSSPGIRARRAVVPPRRWPDDRGAVGTEPAGHDTVRGPKAKFHRSGQGQVERIPARDAHRHSWPPPRPGGNRQESSLRQRAHLTDHNGLKAA